MLTVPEAARRVGRNPETIRRWIREGKLASVRVGTQYLIEEDHLDELMSGAELVPSKVFGETATGEPMPNVVAALQRSRSGR
ncbi:MAG: helix-turn-helix domain-containing protein [Actinomycetota bacterium]|nr:helix-turn-helix domain-containing protein [Actinomycetota bacterium]